MSTRHHIRNLTRSDADSFAKVAIGTGMDATVINMNGTYTVNVKSDKDTDYQARLLKNIAHLEKTEITVNDGHSTDTKASSSVSGSASSSASSSVSGSASSSVSGSSVEKAHRVYREYLNTHHIQPHLAGP